MTCPSVDVSSRSSLHLRMCSPSVFGCGKTLRGFSTLNRTRVKGKKATQLHGFDFEPWALERGIRATGYVRPGTGNALVSARVDGWPYTLHRWRGEIRDAMFVHLGNDRLRGVLVALAIGDQDSIAPDDWEVFWRTGVGHLMSISGLHITMFAGLAFAFVHFAWVRVPALALRLPRARPRWWWASPPPSRIRS